MGRKSRLKRERRAKGEAMFGSSESPVSAYVDESGMVSLFWEEEDGIHSLTPGPISGVAPSEFAEEMTANFQRQMRESPMWDQMVEQFGEDEAERLLKECKFESRGRV